MSENTVNGQSMEELENRDLGTKNIKRLYFTYCVALLGGFFSEVIVYFLEGSIIGRGMRPEIFSIIGIIAPLEMLEAGIGVAMGIGISSLAGIRLGENRQEEARKIHAQGFWFTLILGFAIALLIGSNSESVASYLGAPPELVPDVAYFIRIYMLSYPIGLVGLQLNSVLSVDGKANLAGGIMILASMGALAWLALSALVLKLDVVGVGVYYILSLSIYFIAILYFLFDKKTIFKIHLSDIKIDFKLLFGAIKIGLPYLAQQGGILIFTVAANHILGSKGSITDIACFTMINGYIFYIIALVNQGMINAMQPIAAFNYGAKKIKRVIELLKTSIVSTIALLFVPTILMVIFPRLAVSIFTDEPELINNASSVLRITAIMSAIGFTPTLVAGYFQATDRTLLALITGISRYAFIGVPLMFVLSNTMGLIGVWYAFPAADIISFLFTMVFVLREVRHLKQIEKEEAVVNVSENITI